MQLQNRSPARPGPRRRGGAGRVYLLLFGVVIALMGVLFLLWLGRGYVQARETLGWTPTPCRIVSAWIEEGRFSEGGDRRYRLRVRYGYTFDGREWVGERVTRRDGESRSWERQHRLLDRYAPGSTVEGYVNPASPGEVVLQHETRAPGYTMWFPALFLLGGLGMAARALFLCIKR